MQDRLAEIVSMAKQLDGSNSVAKLNDIKLAIHNFRGASSTLGYRVIAKRSELVDACICEALELVPQPPSTIQLERVKKLANELLLKFTREAYQDNKNELTVSQESTNHGHSAPLVYIVEDDEDQAQYIKKLLLADGYTAEVFSNSTEYRNAINSPAPPPALILMDMVLSNVEDEGLKLIKEKVGSTPIVVTSVKTDIETRIQALRAGANHYITKPFKKEKILSLAEQLTSKRPNRPFRVLVVDDDAITLDFYKHILSNAGIDVHATRDPCQTLNILEEFDPELVLLDVYMPVVSGPELASIIRDSNEFSDVAILFLSSETNLSEQLSAITQGGDDFLVKPIKAEHLITAVTARANRTRQNRRLKSKLNKTIKDKEQVYKKLISKEKRLRNLTSNIPGVIYRMNRNHCFEYLSRCQPMLPVEFCEAGGKGKCWLDFVHLPDKKNYINSFKQLLNGERETVDEYRVSLPSGKEIWVSDHKRSVFNVDGEFVGVDGVFFDVTDRKNTEQSNFQLKERLRRGQMYANVGTWEWVIQTGELFWSERIAPLFGYGQGELETTYDNFIAAVHPEDRQKVINAVNDCVYNGKKYEIEHRVVWPDGTVRWLLEKGAVQKDANNQPLQMIGVVQDIHDRKIAEEKIVASEKKLSEAQSIAKVGNLTIYYNQDKITYSNETLKILGFTRDNAPNTTEGLDRIAHKDDLSSLLQEIEKGKHCGRLDTCHRVVTAQGIKHIHHLGFFEKDNTGNVVRYKGTVQDVTKDVETNQALVLAKEEAERANHAKSDFLSNMSHELRTPLNAIIGFSEVMALDDNLDDEQSDNLKEIRHAGRHLLELINEVLDLAKIESGRAEFKIEPVDTEALIEECLTLLKPLASGRQVSLENHIKQASWVNADRNRLKQVFLNLLSNAVKYNREKGEVIVTAEPYLNRVRVTVSDTGYGISESNQEHLFEPFNRLNAEETEIEGTGIGLTLSKTLMESMHGSIGVASQEQVGSKFWIDIERAVPVPEQVSANTATPQIQGSMTSTALHTVLCIEDNLANLKLVERVLKTKPNIKLESAMDPTEGIKLAIAKQPCLILLDINLPVMTGYEVLTALKESKQTRDIPVVALTANAMPGDFEKAVKAGFDAYLTKPFNFDHFIETLDKYLGLS